MISWGYNILRHPLKYMWFICTPDFSIIPQLHPVGLSHDNFQRSFWWFLNIQIPLRIQQDSRNNSSFYIGTGNRHRIRAWQWHNNLSSSSSSILILTSGHNVQNTCLVLGWLPCFFNHSKTILFQTHFRKKGISVYVLKKYGNFIHSILYTQDFLACWQNSHHNIEKKRKWDI